MPDLYFRVMVSAQGVDYDLSQDLTSLTLEEDDHLADKLTVLVPDPLKVFSYALQEGLDISLDLGYTDNHSVIFRGLVHQIDASFPEDGVPQVTLTAYDNSIRMGLRKRSRVWSDINVQGIVSQIASEYDFFMQDISLPAGGNPTFSGNGIRQHERTDLAFLHDLAADQSCKVFVEAQDAGDMFTFKSEQAIMDADPASTLYYGRTGVAQRLLSFQVNSAVSERRRPEVYASVNPDTGEELTTRREVQTPRDLLGSPFDENLAELGRRDPTRAAALTQLMSATPAAFDTIFEAMGDVERPMQIGLFDAQTLQQHTAPQSVASDEGLAGQGVTEGNKDLRAKRNVRIEAVGGRFSGKWYLRQVRHVVDNNGYRTHFSCTR